MSRAIIKKTSDYFKSKGVILPSISELQNPKLISEDIKNSLIKINNNDINPLNLFRVHWFNKKDQTDFVDELLITRESICDHFPPSGLAWGQI